ncbi:transcriptional regulator NrdR [Candidatus Woesearchaeota archaeon]|nr:transcriptional regulator NrdR [Candidatus Woesearchaeota archaeon]
MKCPYCTSVDSKVVDKRETGEEDITRRRRECLACSKRFTTYERVELIDLVILKKDGRKEEFDRNKVISGLKKACEKRNVSNERIEQIADEIESKIKALETTEVDSKVIGELVMKYLRKLDKVAYIRFASVYRDFADVEEFKTELEKLMKK